MLACLTATLGADTFIYNWTIHEGTTPHGRQRGGGPDTAIVCIYGNCDTWSCNSCHTKPVDERKLVEDREGKHLSKYFPAAAVPLREGQVASRNGNAVTRTGGRLVFQDAKGRKWTFPPDALLVKGRDGQPVFITYPGSIAPAAVR
jgi:hypothetical protein